MEQTAVRAHAGWRADEIDQLWQEILKANEKGQPLRSVFEQMGETLGRKPNSVRNYYYMQLRPQDGHAMRRAAPFETFTEDQVRALVRSVLLARARGQSVRAAVSALSEGDHARMLRYQNKYRSVLKKRPELVAEILNELKAEGVDCPDPLRAAPRAQPDLRVGIQQKAAALQDPQVTQLLTGLDALLSRALDGNPQTGRDRMRVRLEMSQLKFDALCRASGDLLLVCKEYLGQEEPVRTAAMPAFLEALRQHISNVENAMN